ncbi:Helix-turn-helix domain-containing protein [Saccharopolyspora antimicrobica]|uniref:Helix-turn-helix domain-containing protein n=1 Tax=Saccharopolyspora antimicrobica TaxID=455193 RepID=A0A1I5FF78_9PSEU|nr:Scr1 family TA system antitoxin-like transcriptional regulator [Saccharopolyspora antimicrobica]RKT82104.1 helix-turn-helix protein [Saccharopolyspora antimicrobica]SFO22246.1 Helix-turn-helix domain-containing protein [Saccharopolyspora antimicrobica]
MLEPDSEKRDRKDLADTLRRLRKAAGLSGERLAARAAMSQSKISRIESGKVLPTVADVERIMTALDVPSDAQSDILAATRAANVEYVSVRSSARTGIWRRQAEIKALCESSKTVRHFLPIIPSGLLQTAEYARATLTPVIEGNPARDIDRAVRARLDAQDALNDESRRFHFLLTEQAIRIKRAAAPVMVDQLQNMATVSQRPNVDLAILPSSAQIGASPLNIFVVYDERLVTVEMFSGAVALRDYRDISYHLNVFEYFRDRALTGEHARGLLDSAADEFMRARD